MAIKIVFANQKGGVGKTTTSLNVADALIHCGYRVLFLDLDRQRNSSSVYQAVIEGEYTMYDVLENNCEPAEAIQHTAFGDIIPGDPLLEGLAHKLRDSGVGFNCINRVVKKLEDAYDFIIMDTPPARDIYMIAALSAASGVIVPVKTDKFSVDGLKDLIGTINEVKENTNPGLKIYGILLSTYDTRNKLDRKIWEQLPVVAESAGMRVFEHPIRTCQAVVMALAESESLFETEPSSAAAMDYLYTVKELLEVINNG